MSASGAKAARRGERRWSKALSTPLEQLLRGRITGEISVASVARDAGLPGRASALARRVARRTRLYRWERIDVARELAAHFREGLESGRSEDELIETFGDERSAARLIRRAKQRSRHALLRAMRRARQVCVVLIVALSAVYLVFAIPYWTGEPRPTRNMVLEVNAAALAVPENERAWPVYREAYLALGAPLPRELDLGARPGSPGWVEAAQYVRERGDALDTARRAAAMEHLGYVAIEGLHEADAVIFPDAKRVVPASEVTPERMQDTWLLSINYWHLGPMRTICRALRAEAALAAEAGDGDRFMENLRAVLRIALHSKSHNSLITDLFGIAIAGVGVSMVIDALTDAPAALSNEHLVEAAHLLIGMDSDDLLAIRFDGESLRFEDFLDRTHTAGGRLTRRGFEEFLAMQTPGEREYSHLDLGNLVGPIASAVMPGRDETLRLHREAVQEVETHRRIPMWEWDANWWPEKPRGSFLAQARRNWALIMMPVLGRTQQNVERSIQEREAALVAVALERFRREHGDWPASLDDLVPRFLPSVPRDRFDGGPIKYALRAGAPVVYSIGANRSDNGGVAPTIHGRPVVGAVARWAPLGFVELQREAEARGEQSLRHRYVPNGDWVLFPPVRTPEFDADEPD